MAPKTFLDWPVIRQLGSGDFLGRGPRSPRSGPARSRRAPSRRTESSRASVPTAPSAAASGSSSRTSGRSHRGRPRLARLARTAVPQGIGQRAARQQPRPPAQGALPPAGRHAVGEPRPRDGDADDHRPLRREPHAPAGRTGRARPATPRAPWASLRWGARRWTTRRTTSSRSCSQPPAPSRSRTRPVFDTPPRSPVWGPRSDAAAPPSTCRTCPNSDCIVIQGSNMAECHPVAYQWVTEAELKGAKVIHIDPRFTRTSATADRHVPIRAGSDVVFLGALINHVLSNDLFFKEYVVSYTNAATLISEEFRDTEELDGLFSGYDDERGSVRLRELGLRLERGRGGGATDDRAGGEIGDPGSGHVHGEQRSEHAAGDQHGSGGPPLEHARVLRDDTLQDPRTVFQILKRHYSRYTPQMVADTCGISVDDFAYVARAVTENSGRERTTAWVYAVGWTQHTLGAQFIRTSGDPPALAGQHGPPRWRRHGSARPRQHPGLDRHPDAVQPAAGLPRDAGGRSARHLAGLHRGDRRQGAEGLLDPRRRLRRRACSRRGGARRPPPPTTGRSTTCPG